MLSVGKCLFWLAPSEDTVSCCSPLDPFLVSCLLPHSGAIGLLSVQPVQCDFSQDDSTPCTEPGCLSSLPRSHLPGWYCEVDLQSQWRVHRWFCTLFPHPLPPGVMEEEPGLALEKVMGIASQQVPFVRWELQGDLLSALHLRQPGWSLSGGQGTWAMGSQRAYSTPSKAQGARWKSGSRNFKSRQVGRNTDEKLSSG